MPTISTREFLEQSLAFAEMGLREAQLGDRLSHTDGTSNLEYWTKSVELWKARIAHEEAKNPSKIEA